MLNIKTLIASVLLSSVAAVSFAQAPAVPKGAGAVSRTAVKAPAGSAAKSVPHKLTHQTKKYQKVRHPAKKVQKSHATRDTRSAGPGLQAY